MQRKETPLPSITIVVLLALTVVLLVIWYLRH